MPNGGSSSPNLGPLTVQGGGVITPSAGLTVRDSASLGLVGTSYADALAVRGGAPMVNLATASAAFTPVNWNSANLTLTANNVDDPFGNKLGTLAVETASGGAHSLTMKAGISPGLTGFSLAYHLICVSVFARVRLTDDVADRQWAYVGAVDGAGASAVNYFNILKTGGATPADEVAAGSPEASGLSVKQAFWQVYEQRYSPGTFWVRCGAIIQFASNATGKLVFGVAKDDLTGAYTGDTSKGMYFFGTQAEVLSDRMHTYAPNPPVVYPFQAVPPEAYAAGLYEIGNAVAETKIAQDSSAPEMESTDT